ncbi:MAG: threonine--tRNA ligase [Candidatus Nanoarchaeia archaeon]|jgi:threonyl-tRNA synthetase
MKILAIHSDFIKFEPTKKALKNADEVEKKVSEMKECLVVFTSVEKEDENNINGAVDALVNEVKKQAELVKTKRVVLYPYAHLSDDLSKPAAAQDVLVEAEKKLKKSFEVLRAPFGWYKRFEISCKGHPLAEASRHFGADVAKPTGKNEVIDSKKLLDEITKIKLDASKLKENDHRILGQKLDLFSFSETAPGMVFWHNNGLIIYNELINYWRDEHRKAGYQEIATPLILDNRLWKISGHWEKYKENIFLTQYDDRDFAVKPMNCPGGMLVYKTRPKSYKDLPLKVGEVGTVHRVELSGTLGGLFRVIKFTQDDAHIFCTEKQLDDEIMKIVELIFKFYKKFGLQFDHVELSTRPEKRIGSEKMWDKAEKILESILKKKKINYKINLGDGAFYGPKIDFHLKDSLGRTWQTSTVQLDFSMPERFELEYIDEDNKPKRPVMLHRVIYGSLERFMGILLEHNNGNLPTWLSPIQVRIISFSDNNLGSAKSLLQELFDKGLRVDSDFSQKTVNYKIRDAELQKIPYVIVIGDKEEKSKTLAVRAGHKKPIYGIKKVDFINKICEEVKERKLELSY